MSDYTKSTNFTAKDTLPTGNSGKIVKGTEIDTEFTAIASAITSKANLASPAFSGTPTAPTATTGTNTTQVATTAFVTATTSALGTMSTQNANAVAITGGTISGLSSALPVASGGTGAATLTANNVLLGNGTSALQAVAPSTSGNVLTSNGTTWTSAAASINYVKAWVNYQGGNGNTSGTINGSFNVSSITVNGTGNWTVNITTALANTNFAVQTSVNNSSAAGQNAIAYYGAKTTSTINVYCVTGAAGTALSPDNVSVTVFNS